MNNSLDEIRLYITEQNLCKWKIMNSEAVVRICRKYLQDIPVPEAREGGRAAYVFLYGAGHDFFESYLETGNLQLLTNARECFEAAVTNYNDTGGSILPEFYDIILLELGAVCSCQGEHQLAINILNHCIRLSQRNKHTGGVTGALNNLGLVYEKLGEHLKARDCLKECLTLLDEARDKSDFAKTQWNLGRVELKLKNYQEAFVLVSTANTAFKELGLQRFYEQSLADLNRIKEDIGGQDPPTPTRSKLSDFSLLKWLFRAR